jgi:hypothetical protein
MSRDWAPFVIIGLTALLVLAVIVRWLFWEQVLYILGGGIFAEP